MSSSIKDPMLDRGNDLMVSISGIRGVLPEGLDPTNIVQFALAFASITGKKIVIGNDARPTGPILRHLLIGTLIACGKEIIDIGLAPTPTVKAAVVQNNADAGVMISASHNPVQWNAFKFMGPGGFFFDRLLSEKLVEAVKNRSNPSVDYSRMGSLTEKSGIRDHIDSVLKVIPNLKEIREKKYSVIVDGVAGAGREALPLLLEELGCKVLRLYCDATNKGVFPRPPEPTPEALGDFSAMLLKEKPAVGFALDPDADRLVCGSPSEGCINEEYTIPLALLGRKVEIQNTKDPVIVINQSTADLAESVGKKFGARVVLSAVGEANVVEQMKKENAVFGGEGNGGVIHPLIPSYGRDPLAGAAFILSAMADRNASTVDELMKEIPVLYMKKMKQNLEGSSLSRVFELLRGNFPDASVLETDGLRMLFPDGSWIHARASNTEPIIRMIAQAPEQKRLDELLDTCISLIHVGK